MSSSPAHRPGLPGLLLLLLGLAVLGGGAVVVALSLGLVTAGGPGSAHPPCEELPSMAEVTEALRRHADFVDELEAIAPDVRVRAENPCGEGWDRAVVSVHHRTAEQQEVIDELFGRADPIGVPARPVRG